MSKATVTLEDFTEAEVEGLSDEFKIRLQALRYLVGMPIYVTSGVRPDDRGSEHAMGLGVDISDNDKGKEIGSRWRDRVLEASFRVGFPRRGDYDRHIHLGLSTSKDQDVTWWGESS